jgi:hypothetical protein
MSLMVPKVRADHKCRLAPKNTFLALKPGFSCVHNYIFYKFKWVLQRLSTREKIMPGRVLKILGFSKISGISVSVLYHSDATSPLQVFLHIYIYPFAPILKKLLRNSSKTYWFSRCSFEIHAAHSLLIHETGESRLMLASRVHFSITKV